MSKLKTGLFLTAALVASVPALAGTVTQTNLVSDGSVKAAFTDPNLVNPWGVSNAPTGAFWVSDNVTGLTTLYDGTGAIQGLVVTIPPPAGTTGTAAPTGQVYNATPDFKVTKGGKSGAPPFIFATEDGTISGWSPSVDPANGVLAVDNSGTAAVYKGIAIVSLNGANVLLATNFRSGFVEMYDATYKKLGQFRDTDTTYVPADYAPYNVEILGGHIFVTYAKQNHKKHDSISAHGAGVVEEVTASGTLVSRIGVRKGLDAPWGLAIAPSSWGKFAGALLVGNFGDGTVSAYDFKKDVFLGQLRSAPGAKLAIDGLWALSNANLAAKSDPTKIYFTAGPQMETHGLMGSLSYTP